MAGVRERLDDLLGEEGADSRWRDQLGDLLYEGEQIRDAVSIEDARVLVTSHRVLAYTPDTDGPNFRDVERPNVVGVRLGAESNRSLLLRGIQWSVLGLILLGAGLLIDFESIVGDVDLGDGADAIGAGGVLGLVQQLLSLLRQFDEILQLFAGLVLLASAVAFGAYVLTREPRLHIRVAGDDVDDISLPRPADDGETVERLERAIFPDGTGDTRAPGSSGDGRPGGPGDGDDTAMDSGAREDSPLDDRGKAGSGGVDPNPVPLDDDPFREP